MYQDLCPLPHFVWNNQCYAPLTPYCNQTTSNLMATAVKVGKSGDGLLSACTQSVRSQFEIFPPQFSVQMQHKENGVTDVVVCEGGGFLVSSLLCVIRRQYNTP